jgi:hypothetical protein
MCVRERECEREAERANVWDRRKEAGKFVYLFVRGRARGGKRGGRQGKRNETLTGEAALARPCQCRETCIRQDVRHSHTPIHAKEDFAFRVLSSPLPLSSHLLLPPPSLTTPPLPLQSPAPLLFHPLLCLLLRNNVARRWLDGRPAQTAPASGLVQQRARHCQGRLAHTMHSTAML